MFLRFKCRFIPSLSFYAPTVRRSLLALLSLSHKHIYNYINCNILDSFAFRFSPKLPSSIFLFSFCMSVVWKMHCVMKESKNNILDECVYLLQWVCVYVNLFAGECVCAKVVCKPVFIHSREKTRSNHRIVLMVFVCFFAKSQFLSLLCFWTTNVKRPSRVAC